MQSVKLYFGISELLKLSSCNCSSRKSRIDGLKRSGFTTSDKMLVNFRPELAAPCLPDVDNTSLLATGSDL